MKQFLIGLLLTIVGIASLMLIPSKQDPAPMPWEVTIMPDGNSKVFDIHLGTTTYIQAQKILHEYGKTAIFTQEGKPPSVEAYFNSINLGGLSAKLVLNLNVALGDIDDMLHRAMEARVQPSGAHLYKLSNLDNAALINATITAVTYIPSIRLDAQMIQYRFGNARSIEKDLDNPGTEIWHYPSQALAIRISEHEKTILEYSLH